MFVIPKTGRILQLDYSLLVTDRNGLTSVGDNLFEDGFRFCDVLLRKFDVASKYRSAGNAASPAPL